MAVGKQRYGLLLNDAGGIIDDLMFVNRDVAHGGDLFLIVNGACKVGDIAHIQGKTGKRCAVIPMPEMMLLALQGPQAVSALEGLAHDVSSLVFMSGGTFQVAGWDCFITRSGYTGEDDFEISVPAAQVDLWLALCWLSQRSTRSVWEARNSLHLEAGLCQYGNDIDSITTPVEANLNWDIQIIRRIGGESAGGFPGAT